MLLLPRVSVAAAAICFISLSGGAHADANPNECVAAALGGGFEFLTAPLDTVDVATQNDCHLRCQSAEGCNTAMFIPTQGTCVLYSDLMEDLQEAADYEAGSLLLFCEPDAVDVGSASATDIVETPETVVATTRAAGVGRVAFKATCNLMVTARLDPIAITGETSSHMHHAFGNALFSSDIRPEHSAPGTPTTCNYPQDRSFYWAPSLYYRHSETKKLKLVPVFGLMYYGVRADPYLSTGNALHTYPHGLKIIQGDYLLKSAPTEPQKDSDKIDWYCQVVDDKGKIVNASDAMKVFPGMTAPDGQQCHSWQARLTFPSCWDGVNLDSADHKSHMAHTTKRRCPDTHPILVPELKFEVFYRLQPLINEARSNGYTLQLSDFILSTSDVSGAGMHGDFVSGWAHDELAPMLENCNFGKDIRVQGKEASCPVSKYTDASPPDAGSFSVDALMPDEPVDDLDNLPFGNVPLVKRKVVNDEPEPEDNGQRKRYLIVAVCIIAVAVTVIACGFMMCRRVQT